MQLKLALIATFLTLAIAAPQEEQPALKVRGPAPLPEAAAEITPREADDSILEKRACNYNKGCRSSQGIKAGKYCGYCYEVWGSLKSKPPHACDLCPPKDVQKDCRLTRPRHKPLPA